MVNAVNLLGDVNAWLLDLDVCVITVIWGARDSLGVNTSCVLAAILEVFSDNCGDCEFSFSALL